MDALFLEDIGHLRSPPRCRENRNFETLLDKQGAIDEQGMISSASIPSRAPGSGTHHHLRKHPAGDQNTITSGGTARDRRHLEGEAIPLIARILAVADSYDAITSNRPYRERRHKSEAVEEIKRCAGTQFDPAVVCAFLRSVEKQRI